MRRRTFLALSALVSVVVVSISVLSAEDQATGSFKKISLAEFEAMQHDRDVVILDVRTPEEFNAGHVPGALNINWRSRDFNEQVEKLDKSRPYAVYCLAGVRSVNACERLGELGFKSLSEFSGGWRVYGTSGKPIETGTAKPVAAKDDAAPHHKLVRPDKIDWKDGPPSLPPGAKMVILEGDPSKDGYFALRLQFPDGYKIPAHWHPNVERLTIISGTFHLGMGEKFDTAKAESLPAGSYVSMPPKMKHFAWAEGPTVIQLATSGPWEIHYLNPADDPRQQSKKE